MKTIKVSLVAAFSAMLMMTSCLSDGNNEKTFSTYGYVDAYSKTNYQNALFVAEDDYPVYSSALAKVSSGSYIGAQITINYDDENNADALSKGYYAGQVTVLTDPIEVFNNPLVSRDLDLETPLENERELSGIGVWNYVNNAIIAIAGISKVDKNSSVKFALQYNPYQEPVVESNNTIYEVYLRGQVIPGNESSSTSTSYEETFALPLGQGISIMKNNESGSDKYFYLRLNYVKEISEGGEITWEKSSSLIPVNPKI